jgi:hypothetical protein
MSVEECFRGIRDIATDADGGSFPTIKARIDRFAAELQSSELDGRQFLGELRDKLESAAAEAAPTAASDLLEKAAQYANRLWSRWG